MIVDRDTEEFWRSAAEQKLVYAQCQRCSTVIFYPRSHCTNCLRGDVRWHVSNGDGVVYSFTVVRKSADPELRKSLPYIIAYIDVDEGFRMMSTIRSPAGPDAVKIGDRLQLAWEVRGDQYVPIFKPANAD